MHAHHELRVVQHQVVVAKNVLHDCLRLRNVVSVPDAEHEVHAACRLGRDVIDYVAPDLVVRHDQHLVVQGRDHGGNQGHGVDLAFHAGRRHQVAHIKRPVEHDHQAGGEVGKRVLQGEAEHETGDPEAGEHRSEVNSQHREDHQESQQPYERRSHADQKPAEKLRGLDTGRSERLVRYPSGQARKNPEYEEDQEDGGRLDQDASATISQPLTKLLPPVFDQAADDLRVQNAQPQLAGRFE